MPVGSATFDVSGVNLETLVFGSASPRVVGKGNKSSCSYEDVSGDFSTMLEGMPDGYIDLVCQYSMFDLGELSGATSVTLRGALMSGRSFEGTDTINIVKDCGF